jgi:hypothetical protein
MRIYITTLTVLLLLLVTSRAEKLSVGMSLDAARTILKQAKAEETPNMYHFPWTSGLVEIKEVMKDGESLENYLDRIGSELDSERKKNPPKHGYSIFFSLSDNTQLELVLEVDGDLKRIHRIRLGEAQKIYEGKFEWIRAGEEGKVKELKAMEPIR